MTQRNISTIIFGVIVFLAVIIFLLIQNAKDKKKYISRSPSSVLDENSAGVTNETDRQ